MLIGSPGSRKSTAILQAKKVLSAAEYRTFAANKTTKEKFLLDLEGAPEDPKGSSPSNHIVLQNLLGDYGGEDDTSGQDPKEIFIVADEFNEFTGSGNIEFLSLLGSLWDWDDENTFFKFRLKNSKSVHIFQPTLSILSGNTHDGFKEAFPPQAPGQGILSRIILVYSEPSGRKITFPREPSNAISTSLLHTFGQIKEKVQGAATLTEAASNALNMIYRSWADLEDQRFKHYSTRRFTHLLKLTLVCAASRVSTVIDLQDVMLSSSLLSYTEAFMPKALGEFGKSRNADASNKIMEILYAARKPVKMETLWKAVQQDLEKLTDLSGLLNNLQSADKIQAVKGEGFLPKQKPLDRKLLYTDYNLLKEYKNGN